MNYYIYDYDQDFDPLQGELDGQLTHVFGDQLTRARNLLKGRSLAEFYNALDALDWMLREGSGPHLRNTLAEADAFGISFTSRVKALKAYRELFDIQDQAQFPNAHWYEYFAVLSIAYVLEALREIAPSKGEQANDSGIYQDIEWPMECMEAVCLAECEAELEQQLARQQKEQVKAIGSKGGRLRVAKFDALRIKVLKFYDEKGLNSRSNREAGKRIYQAMKADIDAVLTTDDPVHRIATWIGKYKKQSSEQ
jgi:hypothetical protein